MSPKVYKLRQEVMRLIRIANQLSPLPRITVRVAHDDDKIAGVARLGKNIIWITESFVSSRMVVFHEILHAVYNLPHIKGCPLMDANPNHNLSDKECNELFLKYVRMKQNQTLPTRTEKVRTALMEAPL